MSQADDPHPGIPTRVIHESYVEMLNGMRQYYRAEQQGSQNHMQRAHADLQHKVLSFFEVLRPYLKSKNAVEEYWQGKPPDYSGNDGVAVLDSQTHRVPVDTDKLDKDWKNRSMEWLHEQAVNSQPMLNGNAKIEDLYHDSDSGTLLLQVNQYQTGLSQLDGKYNLTATKVNRGSSYMRSHSSTETQKRKLPVDKLFAAAHALEEAADRLGKLAEIDEAVPRTEITKEMIDEVEEWRQQNLE